MIHAVVFDWVGTMIDYGSRAPTKVLQTLFEEIGLPISAEESHLTNGLFHSKQIEAVLQIPDVAARWQEKFGKPSDSTDVDRLFERLMPIQAEIIPNYCDLIPGAVESFQWCVDRMIHVGSSTGYNRELMNIVTPLAKQNGYAPAITLCDEDAPNGTPAPWLIFKIAEFFLKIDLLRFEDSEFCRQTLPIPSQVLARPLLFFF